MQLAYRAKKILLTRIKRPILSVSDMNCAYNQMPLDKPSQRFTNFVIAGQQYCFKRSFYGISIGPAAFSSFVSSIFKLRLRKNKLSLILMMFPFKIPQQTQCYKHLISITTFSKKKTSKPLQKNPSFSCTQLFFWDIKYKTITYNPSDAK